MISDLKAADIWLRGLSESAARRFELISHCQSWPQLSSASMIRGISVLCALYVARHDVKHTHGRPDSADSVVCYPASGQGSSASRLAIVMLDCRGGGSDEYAVPAGLTYDEFLEVVEEKPSKWGIGIDRCGWRCSPLFADWVEAIHD